MSLNENAHKNVKNGPKMVKNGPKMVKNPLFVKLRKPIPPFERSGPKIFVVDSEAYTYEISSYAVKNKRFYVLEWKYAQNAKKGPKTVIRPLYMKF